MTVTPLDQCQRALAVAQGLRGHVHSDEGGRARRVDRDGWPLQAERVRDAAGGDAAGASGAEVALQVGGVAVEADAVVVVHDAREHARGAAAYGRGVDPGALEGLPGRLQQQTVLRVGGEGLAGG
ncbi:hypothetical protein GCM10020000_52750 [Streptomyces olivoverticillatus]